MQSFDHKLVIDPKFIEYLNSLKLGHDRSVLIAVIRIVKVTNDKLSEIEPKAMEQFIDKPLPAIKVEKPSRKYIKDATAKDVKHFANWASKYVSGFGKSQDYKDLMALANGHDNPVGPRFTKYSITRTDVPVDVVMVVYPKGNKVVKDLAGYGKDCHYTFKFETNDGRVGSIVMDLPMHKD